MNVSACCLSPSKIQGGEPIMCTLGFAGIGTKCAIGTGTGTPPPGPPGSPGLGGLSPPQQVEKLLYPEDRCTCGLKWHCIPHDTCFIPDLCLSEGSGSFPPVKPSHPSWADFSYDWYCEFMSRLKLHPHSPLPCFGSEVEYSPLVMPYYQVPPPSP